MGSRARRRAREARRVRDRNEAIEGIIVLLQIAIERFNRREIPLSDVEYLHSILLEHNINVEIVAEKICYSTTRCLRC